MLTWHSCTPCPYHCSPRKDEYIINAAQWTAGGACLNFFGHTSCPEQRHLMVVSSPAKCALVNPAVSHLTFFSMQPWKMNALSTYLSTSTISICSRANIMSVAPFGWWCSHLSAKHGAWGFTYVSSFTTNFISLSFLPPFFPRASLVCSTCLCWAKQLHCLFASLPLAP